MASTNDQGTDFFAWVFVAALILGGLWLFSSLVDASGIADHHEPDPSCQYVDCGGDGSTEADY
jgi:hypothetical protein